MKKVFFLLTLSLSALMVSAKCTVMDETQNIEQTAADLTEEMRYNLDENGMITEMGYEANYEFVMEPDSPLDWNNFYLYRRVGAGGIGNGYWELIQ